MPYTETLSQRIEEAALNAWPALNTWLYDGWVLRLANGYTKRANSVTPLYPGQLDLVEKIDFCEGFYKKQHLPPIFRLTTIMNETGLDEQLAARNYRHIDPTMVQSLMLDQTFFNFSAGASILDGKEGIQSWLKAFHKLNKQREDAGTHEKMLHNILGQVGGMILTVDQEIVACGLGVVEGHFVGLFDIVTAEGHRRKGYGTAVTQSLLAWGKSSGARCAYLQVMENNRAAAALYSQLGFQENYRYWYRAAP